MSDKDVWSKKPPRMVHPDIGLLYYASVPIDEWLPELKARLDLLTEENRQLREALEISADEIKEKMYSGWYQAQVKQGGVIYMYELDRRKLNAAREWVKEHPGFEELEKILEVKK